MPTQQELDAVYIGVAQLHADLSKAVRRKVGACIVTKHGVIVPGYNGTVAGSDVKGEEHIDGVLTTTPAMLHAELNCLLKCSKEGISSEGSTLYLTLSPCERCAAMIAGAGIKRVVYKEKYRDTSGITALYRYNIPIEEFKES